MPETQSCCIIKKEEKADENSYMKIAGPQYTLLSSVSNTSRHPTLKHRYICSTEQSITASTNSTNSLPISQHNLPTCPSNATNRPQVRPESMFHYNFSQDKMQDSKFLPSSPNSIMYRTDDQAASFRGLVKRKHSRSLILSPSPQLQFSSSILKFYYAINCTN